MSSKGNTIKKWVSTENSRKNHDRIFNTKENPCDNCDCDMLIGIGCICEDKVDYDLEKKHPIESK